MGAFCTSVGFPRSRINMKLKTVLLAFILPMPCFGSAKKQPNIVLIMADDMGYECLGANGGADYKTPFLDSLPKEACDSSTPTPSPFAHQVA